LSCGLSPGQKSSDPPAALTWVTEATDEPVLFIEQLDDTGEGLDARLLVSEKLFAWDIDNEGNVVRRGTLSA
jgi:hypothetical protein